MLYERASKVRRRIAADGTVIEPLDEAAAEATLRAAFETGCRSLAVCLMHAYRNQSTRKQVGRIAERIGFPTVVLPPGCPV